VSFQAMTWAVSQECNSPGEKLVLLMLANCCNAHSGRCNPSHKRLSAECSMGVSTLKRHLAALAERGLLRIIASSLDGVSLPNQYDLNLEGVGPDRAGGSAQIGPGVGPNRATNQESNQEDKPKNKSADADSSTALGDAAAEDHGGDADNEAGDLLGDQSQAKPTRRAVPACPHGEIIALYHELLPTLRGVRVWQGRREKNLQARWREDPDRQSLDWWRRFFAYVAQSDFLMGRKTDFVADLAWLICPENFAKTIEGTYENRRRSA